MDEQQLQGFKQQLSALREELLGHLDLSDAASQVVELDQTVVGRLSRMDAMQQQQMSQASRSQYRQRLVKVERALSVIASDDGSCGSYGYCEDCGNQINLERLNISPESLYCLLCQQRTEE
ncbi:MAG: TraR/DksA C4-type zinc finger protein [Porticoccaceae bacterium]